MATWEFTSEHSSSYDVDGLIEKLNVRAAAGWEVVTIIPTGGDVTAFFKREKEDGADDAMTSDKDDKKDTDKEAAPVAGGLGSLAAGTTSTSHDKADATEEKESDKTPSPVAATPVAEAASLSMSERLDAIRDSVAASPAATTATSTPDPIKEPSGWAVAPETPSPGGAATPASTAPSTSSTPSVTTPTVSTPASTTAAASTASPWTNSSSTTTTPSTPSSAAAEPMAPIGGSTTPGAAAPGATAPGASAQGAAASPAPAPSAPTPAPAPVVTTPAGWYPDPSGRFEMRYWDGQQWTEYVSRAGQQFTDPPVA